MPATLEDIALRTHMNLPYEQVLERVATALQAEGFGVLTEIDVQATLKKKLNVDFRRYAILGACNAPVAHQALTTELEIGLLLPCNVIVYEDDTGTVVSILDPQVLVTLSGNTALQSPMADAHARLARVITALAQA